MKNKLSMNFSQKRRPEANSGDGPERGRETEAAQAAVFSPRRREATRREPGRRDNQKRRPIANSGDGPEASAISCLRRAVFAVK